MGGAERDLSELERLPANTAIAISGTFNSYAFINYIHKLAEKYPNELGELVEQKKQIEAASQMFGIDYNLLSDELSSGATFVLTLDENDHVEIDKNMQVPRPELLVISKNAWE